MTISRTRNEFSAGGVIYKRNSRLSRASGQKKAEVAIEVVLIAKKQPAGRHRGRTVWCLPKGKIEKSETAQQAAAREMQEETGMSGKLIELLGDVAYQYISPVDKARVFKKVRFFLFEYADGLPASHDIEADEARWFAPLEALKIMRYASEKRIMQKAMEAVRL